MYVYHVCALLGKASKESLEKYVEEGKENEKMEGFVESDQTLRSTMEIKKKKSNYLFKEGNGTLMIWNVKVKVLMLLIGKFEQEG